MSRGRVPSEAATSSPSASRSSGRIRHSATTKPTTKYGAIERSVSQPVVVSPPARKKIADGTRFG